MGKQDLNAAILTARKPLELCLNMRYWSVPQAPGVHPGHVPSPSGMKVRCKALLPKFWFSWQGWRHRGAQCTLVRRVGCWGVLRSTTIHSMALALKIAPAKMGLIKILARMLVSSFYFLLFKICVLHGVKVQTSLEVSYRIHGLAFLKPWKSSEIADKPQVCSWPNLKT